MSAFMCDDELFTAIADNLCRTYLDQRQDTLVESIMANRIDGSLHVGNNPTDWAEAMVQGWALANANATWARYNTVVNVSPVRCTFEGKRLPLPKLYKLIECLSYQCHESVGMTLPDDKPNAAKREHDIRLSEMHKALDIIANAVISKTPEYEAAEWGSV